jgi:hypothetical protein
MVTAREEQAIPRTCNNTPSHPTSTISRQLGTQWQQLHPWIQHRFAHEPAMHEHVFYRGFMEDIRCSRAGKLFAYFTRIIGNPLTPHEGQNVRMDVLLHRCAGKKGVFWRRTYYYPGRAPYTVTSVKRESHKGEMLECVGGGFGMILRLSAEQGNLHFRSTRYFWQAGRLRIPLPHWMGPGSTHVVHEQVTGKLFRFTITMRHPLLGETFYQTGVFCEE